jgi:hypothetical protein
LRKLASELWQHFLKSLTSNAQKATLELAQDCAILRAGEIIMALEFIGKDPESDTNNCSSVSVDEETGDFLLCGWTVTDPNTLATIAGHSPIAGNESVVRLPARMRAILQEAVNGHSATVQRVDRGDNTISGAPRVAGHVHT